MAKNSTKIIAVILALGGAYFIYKYFKPSTKDKKDKKDNNNSGVDTTPTPTPTGEANFPLKKGAKGAKVKELQNLLLKLDSKALPKYGADGDFGSETEAAVEKVLGKKTVEMSDMTKLQEMYKKRFLIYQPNTVKPDLPLFYGGVK